MSHLIRRTGFTLIELVVVLVVIAVIAGLLLPAMNHNRVPYRNAQCKNNIRQLALAIQNFETTKQRYPGIQNDFGATGPTDKKIGSWAVALFPYIEQVALRDLWDDPTRNQDWFNTAAPTSVNRFSTRENIEFFYPNIPLFECPGDFANDDEEYAKNSYALNAGFAPIFNTDAGTALGYTTAYNEADSVRSQRVSNTVFTNQAIGTFGYSAAINSNSVRDGLSQTIGVVENLQASSWDYATGLPGEGDQFDDSVRSHLGFMYLYRLDDPSRTTKKIGGKLALAEPLETTNLIDGNRLKASVGDVNAARPSSDHDGVVNYAMLDGSVSGLSNSIDYRVYQALITPRSREADIPDDLYRLKTEDFAP